MRRLSFFTFLVFFRNAEIHMDLLAMLAMVLLIESVAEGQGDDGDHGTT